MITYVTIEKSFKFQRSIDLEKSIKIHPKTVS